MDGLYARKQRDAFSIRSGHLVNSALSSEPDDAKEILPSGVDVGNGTAVIHELLRV